MKRNNYWIAALALVIISFTACEKGEGPIVEDELFVPPFTAIDLDINRCDVYLTQDTFYRVLVEGQQNIIDLIETDTDGNIWKIEFDRGARKFTRLKIYITMPQVEAILNHSGGDIINLGELDVNGQDIFVENYGSGDIQVDLTTADKVETRVGGSGNVYISGLCTTHNTWIEGSGDLRSFQLYSDVCIVKSLGSGDAEVFADDLLDATIEGSGDVYYRGPGTVQYSITGSGDLFNAN